MSCMMTEGPPCMNLARSVWWRSSHHLVGEKGLAGGDGGTGQTSCVHTTCGDA